jgi:hypothetical protein
MPALIAVRNERNVRELAARVYGTSNAAALDRAERALLRANPQLGTTTGLRAGAVISVPDVSGLAVRADATGDDPVGALRGALAEAAAAYRAHLEQSLDARGAELDAQDKLVKAKEIAAAIKAEPGGPELQKQLSETLGQRAKAVAEARKAHAVLFDRIAADLKALDPG